MFKVSSLLLNICFALIIGSVSVVFIASNSRAKAVNPDPTITNVIARDCSTGSSCAGTTNIEVDGTNFTLEARVKLNDGNDINGTFVGGDGSTKILTDFTGLVSCQEYIVIVYFPQPDNRTAFALFTYNPYGNCASPSPSPSPSPSASPSASPSVSPSPSNSASPSPAPAPSNNSNGGNSSSGVSCGAESPKAPVLSGNTLGQNLINLFWNAVSPVTHYMVRYGLASGNYIFGASNIGNTNSFNVGSLVSGTNYFFQIAGVNNCQGGTWSNEISVASRFGSGTGGEENSVTVTSKPSPTPQITPRAASTENTEVLGSTEITESPFPWWIFIILGIFSLGVATYIQRKRKSKKVRQ